MPSPKQVLVGVLGLGLAVTGLSFVAAPSAQANPAGTDLVISEVYGGGGNSGAPYTNDFVELYNPTGAPILLDGLGLEYKSSGGGSGGVVSLSGSVPAERNFLVQLAAGAGSADPLPAPDQTGTLNMSGTNGRVFLLPTTSAYAGADGNVAGSADIIDMVGFGSAITFETAATPVLSNSTSASRDASGTDSDDNSADFTVGAPTPTNSTFDPDALAVTDPADVSAYVDEAITPFTLSATGGTGPYTWSSTALPAGITLDAGTGEVSGTPTAIAATEVTFTVTDSADPVATADAIVTFDVTAAPELMPIADIQGTVDASLLVDQTVLTEGIVTAAYPSGGLFGFYLQTPGTGGVLDLGTHTSSDALFVYQTQAAGAVTVAPGDHVQVRGVVTEYAGLTEVTVSSASEITVLAGADPVTPVTSDWPATDAEKESLEGMLFTPPGNFTVTNTYSTNQYGEVGLAHGTQPLLQQTEVAEPGSVEADDVVADNAVRGVVLDDGSSTNYLALSGGLLVNGDKTPAYLTDLPSVGAPVTFTDDVIFSEGGSPSAPTYRFQPTQYVEGPDNTGSPVTFTDTRTAAPDDANLTEAGTPELKVASFNVLNYFTTLGDPDDDNVGNGGCLAYTDRDGDGNNVRTGCDLRGAWDPVDFARQQAKIVAAINALDADVVGLMEIENSARLGETEDEATQALVDALNADAGAGTWAANPSSAELPPAAGQDVITNAIIYKPASVERVGDSRALGDLSQDGEAFQNAREPLAQAFAPLGGGVPFLVVVNHFKSKGSAGPWPGDTDSGDGQGNSNESRVRQAEALRDWVPSVQADSGADDVFLMGDFNAYTQEDPLQVLYDAGYADAEAHFDNGEYSYSFGGQSGSLDHVLANPSALARLTGADIWNINSGESVALEYSRYNYHSTDFHSADVYRSSDHDPVLVGLGAGVDDGLTDVQILGTNDFHGRLEENAFGGEAGAAVLSGAVKELRAANPRTVFAAAGDLIGASTFESFIQEDKPTIDALNEAGLDVSAVGNHELDKGYDDLVDRVMAAYDADTNARGGAEWQYIAGNLEITATGDPAVPATWTKSFGDVEVGFVGAVTEDLPSLVSPDGIADITVTDIVDSTNTYADELKAGGADVVVLLVHEGSPSTDCGTMTDPETTWGNIVTGVNDNVDAIISGHTHLAYDCAFPVDGWADREVTERPVVSAGQYGQNLNQLVFSVDDATGEVLGVTQELLPLLGNYDADPEVTAIVDAAVAEAEVLGAVELGAVEDPFNRARLGDGTTENRGGESTLGNLVAEVHRWATEAPESGGAQIAFMNPGGLRTDMPGPAVTYKQAAGVQPFANTLVNMDLTGEQLETLLEEQWQRTAGGTVPSRPFLRLGVSEGFTYTYVQSPVTVEGTDTFEGEITGMWLDGVPIEPAATYSVTVNSFLAAGGDNFRELTNGVGKTDTGKVDLEAMVDYLAEYPAEAPLPVDYSQRAVEVSGVKRVPTGGRVTFDVASWSMSSADDVKDSEIRVMLGERLLGTATLDNTVGEQPFDDTGTATVKVDLPRRTPVGRTTLTLVGADTGTEMQVPLRVVKGKVKMTASVKPKRIVKKKTRATVVVKVVNADGVPENGKVTVNAKGIKKVTKKVVNGKAKLRLGVFKTKGRKVLTIKYSGSALLLPKTIKKTIRVRR